MNNSGNLLVTGIVNAKNKSTVDNGDALTFENGLVAESGSTVNNNTAQKTITLKGTSTFAADSTLSNSGNLIVAGTANFEAAAASVKIGTDATLKVVSGGTANMSSAVLKSFLTGKVQSTADNTGLINLTDSGNTAIALGDGGEVFSSTAAGAMNA